MSKILVVDDDSDVLQILQWFLPRKNPKHAYTFASSGIEAQKFMKDERFDLLLTDIHMPEYSGCQLAQWARERDANLTIVFLTGYQYTDEIEKCVSAVGVAARLTKPNDLMEIGAYIDSALLVATA